MMGDKSPKKNKEKRKQKKEIKKKGIPSVLPATPTSTSK
jgi:hypothetical protein